MSTAAALIAGFRSSRFQASLAEMVRLRDANPRPATVLAFPLPRGSPPNAARVPGFVRPYLAMEQDCSSYSLPSVRKASSVPPSKRPAARADEAQPFLKYTVGTSGAGG